MIREDEARMTFTEHLAELRVRIIRSAWAVAIAFLVVYIFSNQLLTLLTRPLRQAGMEKSLWVVLNPLESLVVKLKLSGYGALLVASPVLVYQLAAFIFPGLKTSERRLVKYVIVGCSAFAVFGVLVAYLGVFPLVMPFLISYAPSFVQQQFRLNETIGQLLLGFLGFALAFQFPMVVFALVYLDLLSPDTLKKYRRPAIIVEAVTAAILTPPDPISMMIMLIPMVILYEVSIWVSYLIVRKRKSGETAT